MLVEPRIKIKPNYEKFLSKHLGGKMKEPL